MQPVWRLYTKDYTASLHITVKVSAAALFLASVCHDERDTQSGRWTGDVTWVSFFHYRTVCAITTFPTTDDLFEYLAWNNAMLCALEPLDLQISALFFLFNKMHTLRAWIITLCLTPCSWGTCEWVGRGRHWVGQWLICIIKVSHIPNETNVLSHSRI